MDAGISGSFAVMDRKIGGGSTYELRFNQWKTAL